MKKIWVILFLLLQISYYSKGGDIRAADITVKQDSLNSMLFNVTVKYLWFNLFVPDSIPISWGDNATTFIFKTDSVGLSGDLAIVIYKGSHTYNSNYADSTVHISNSYPNRMAEILNMDNSEHYPLYIEALVNLHFQHNILNNSSPTFLASPFVLQSIPTITYNPEIFDADNDSMTAELISPLVSADLEAAGYILPAKLGKTTFTFNNASGSFVWDSIDFFGYFGIAYKISEYRNGVLIGSVMRDMLLETATLSGINDVSVACAEELIYPNPAGNILFIKSKQEIIKQVEITDLSGQILFIKNITGYSPDKTLDVSMLVPGLYFVIIKDESGNVIIKKLIKE